MTNFDNITNVLIYKQLHPPQYRIHRFNGNGVYGTVLSKGMYIRFDVQGIGKISQYFIYDIQNKIVKYRYYYYSEEQRIKDLKKQRKKDLKQKEIRKKMKIEAKKQENNSSKNI
jgi:hypothetical protein